MSAVCGEVNAKNGLGAYSGFKRLIVNLDKGAAQIDSDDVPAVLDQGASAYKRISFDTDWTLECTVRQVS